MTSEAGQAPATEAGTEMHFYMLGFLSAAVPERDRRKVLETVRRYTLAIEAEAVAAERARIAEAVRGLAVRKTVKGESDWQNGFRQSRNETVAAVLAIIEAAPKP